MNVKVVLATVGAFGILSCLTVAAEPPLEESSELLSSSRQGGITQQELPKTERSQAQEGTERKAQARTKVKTVDREQRKTGERRSSQMVVPEPNAKKRQKDKLDAGKNSGEVGADLQRAVDELRKMRRQARSRSLYRMKKKSSEEPIMDIQPW